MAAVKSRQDYRRTENRFETDFILPSKTNDAIPILAPSTRTSNVTSSSAPKNNDSARSYNGSSDSPSKETPLFIPPRKLGKPKFLDNFPAKTPPSVSQQALKEGTTRDVFERSSVSRTQSPQVNGGLHNLQNSPAPQLAAESSLDIYAHNYIPMWQTAINESPAVPRLCCRLSTIDYARYINSFAGSRTLSTVAQIKIPPIHTVRPRVSSPAENLLPEQYGEYFADALQNEIAAQVEEIKSFSMFQVTFEVEDPSQQMYRFTIPGLREHSPRVDLGDVVKIRPLIAAIPQPHFLNREGNLERMPEFSGFEFYAIVWGISRAHEQIVIRMDGFMPNLFHACNIIFTVQENRCAPLWRSIDLTARSLTGVKVPSGPWLRQMLFPDKQHARWQSSLSRGSFDLKWFDSELNFEQQKAVDAVVTANYGGVPYLISGPPGTGKTKTIVETALQLLQSETSELVPHLLVCAPSDPAADTLATRLSAHLDPSSMFRLNSWTRSFAEVPGNLLPYTYAENSLFSLPEFETMMSYKVVVTTCRDADMLVQARLTNGAMAYLAQKMLSAIAPHFSKSMNSNQLIHWTALLLDEAAQAIEPEALIPLSVVDPAFSIATAGGVSTEWSLPVPQLIMAGDEFQLGPRLSLKSASPLAMSLFGRLFARSLYSAHPLSRAAARKPLTSAMLPILRPMFTNLVRNYRSHPAILTVPSVLFYADTLIAENATLSEVVRTWPGWQEAGSVFGSMRVAVAKNDGGDGEPPISRPRSSGCWPLLFVENSGSDALESILAGNGTGAGGLFNASEAAIALRIVKSLLGHSLPSLPAERVQGGLLHMRSREDASPMVANVGAVQAREIIVMSPFRAQVNHLRRIFRESKLYDVSIGPLEAFQGLESRIVVLCTTRTKLGTDDQGKDRFVREDQARGLGVIGEQKKFNVAITRAKEGLIVIGNKECLTCTDDEAWVEFLAFCKRIETGSSRNKTRLQRSGTHTQRQGRLERALRYAENLDRSRAEPRDEEDGVLERPTLGFGYPSYPRSLRNRLRGNMLSLDEDMFREGLRIADDMMDSADEDMVYGEGDYEDDGSQDKRDDTTDSSANHPRQLTPTSANPELNRQYAGRATMPSMDGEPLAPHIQRPPKTVGTYSETLIDISTTPRSTSRGASGAVADASAKVDHEILNGMQFGSFKLPMAPSAGESIVRGLENVDAHGNKIVNDFDRNPEAEFERADCATQ